MRNRVGWPPLLEWGFDFGLAAVAVITSLSIGIFVWPFAIAMVFAGRRNRSWPGPVFGSLLGVGGVCLLVAYLNRTYNPCPPSGIELFAPGGHFACGGLNPRPWLTIGALLAGAGWRDTWLSGALTLPRLPRVFVNAERDT